MAKVFWSQYVNHLNKYRTKRYLYSITKGTSQESRSIETEKDDGKKN